MSTIQRHTIDDFKKAIHLNSDNPNYFFKKFKNGGPFPNQPYRTETFGIALITKGQISLTTGLTDHEIKAPALLTMGPHVIRKWTNKYPSAKMSTIFFKREFLTTHYANRNLLDNKPFFELPEFHVFHLNTKDLDCVKSIFKNLKSFIRSQYLHKDDFVREQIAILFYMVDELHHHHLRHNNLTINSMIADFINLVAKDIHRHRDVAYYAKSLHTTSKNLTRYIKLETGKTASQFIHEFLLLEAKIMLQNPDLTISETAYRLSFPDPSTFGKYFKKYSGKTPSAYRLEILTT